MAKGQELTSLLPKTVEIKADGITVRVAGNAQENTIMNYFMLAQVRALIQENVKRYMEKDITVTPKELKDLVEAAKGLAESSTSVYKSEEAPISNKPAEKPPASGEVPDFSKLTVVKEEEK